ncbi:FdrA family protein [Pseudonocardia acaciae]|uniref:FdrA family protein n=1 Tax=Pseudonocardia acaciae TaxID=551276 RepID=UPI00048A54BA|nr:FdrA family protein [Pseudonocardia acaciae]
MSVVHVEARQGAYADSVALMQVSKAAAATDGVEAALVAMATELNLGLLGSMGFARPDPVGPNDLLVALRARDHTTLAAGLATVEQGLAPRPRAAPGVLGEQAPRTVSSAARRAGPGLALVSVPGEHAFTEAMDALDAGCDVMIFSDNVPVEQEILLKDTAAARDLLVLGPDCGTAVIDGVGLGFAHNLAPGPVGVVAASGTGAQQVLCLLDAAGVGISAALGVGGRDLSGAVAGRSTRAALAALDDDPATELILVVSKPPDEKVARQVREYALGLRTPVQFALVGPGQPDLTAATETALRGLGVAVPRWPRWPNSHPGPRPGSLRGLFAGGTLCDEAMVIAADRLGPVLSNIPLRPEWRTHPHAPTPGHSMIDFGDDELTTGRAHPMIDQSLRLARLAAEASDPATSVILLDVVLGHGAHPDPAAELAPAIATARRAGRVATVISLIGAAADPQDLAGQAVALRDAGAHVFLSNAHAAAFACDLIATGG